MQPELSALLPEQFTVYLSRHATPDRSRYDIPYHLPPGPQLTERGLSEAAELGAFFQREGVPFLHVSPLERTQRTAAVASEVCGATWVINQDIAEWRPEEDEPIVLARASRAFLAVAQESQERGVPVAIVSHGGPIFALLKALGAPSGAINSCRIYDGRNPICAAGAWSVAREDGRLRIEMAFAPRGYSLPAYENRRFIIETEAESPALSSD